MSKLTYKYQATIPRQVREALVLAAGDRVEFLINPEGDVRIRKAYPVDPELSSIDALLAPEWGSDADEDAYADL